MKHRVIAILLLLAACTPGGSPPAPIPPAKPEEIPKPPVSAAPLIWQPGHWDWTGSSYVWIPGQYVDSSGHTGTWMPAWWESTSSGWVWHPAHWL